MAAMGVAVEVVAIGVVATVEEVEAAAADPDEVFQWLQEVEGGVQLRMDGSFGWPDPDEPPRSYGADVAVLLVFPENHVGIHYHLAFHDYRRWQSSCSLTCSRHHRDLS